MKMITSSKPYSFVYQDRSFSQQPETKSYSLSLKLFSGLSRRSSDIKDLAQFQYFERGLSTSTDEIVNISPKEARLMCITYNIEYACNQFIDKEDEKITYTIIKDDIQQSVTFKEVQLISPIHHSLCMGKRYCYRIVTKSETNQKMIVFRCKNQKERDYWMKEIRCALSNVSDFLITEENSLRINIQECRNLALTNKYFCEIKLDDLIYARTSVKEMKDTCFWGEEFDLTGLSDIKLIAITIWKLPRDKEKDRHPQIVSHVNISIETINRHCITEKWYSPSPVYLPNVNEIPSHNLTFSAACDLDCPPDIKPKDRTLPNQVIDSAPLLRIKSRYFPLKVLDPKFYSEVLYFLEKNGVDLFRELDVNLKAKYREELILPMVQLSIRKKWIDEFLSELILKESKHCDVNVILRGNSMATKAMECFLKIECGDYLRDILGNVIKDIVNCYNDLEIDRIRLVKMKMSASVSSIRKRIKRLEKLVDNILTKVFNSMDIIPRRVKLAFNLIRVKLKSYEKTYSGFTEKVVSACFFLRLVCPAIMTPYLFHLLPDYSQNPHINRSFTLVAKCVQNVANFAAIDDQKEDYMQSMSLFCKEYYSKMHRFLEILSTYDDNTDYEFTDRSPLPNYDQIGFSMEMARLCYHIDYCLNTFVDKSTKLETEAKDLLSQIKCVEKQLSVGTDTMERKYAAREFTESGKLIGTTNESSGYFSMQELQIGASNNHVNQVLSPVTTSLNKVTQLSKLPKKCIPKTASSKSKNFQDALSLIKIIRLEKDRLQLMTDVINQYPDDEDKTEDTSDHLYINIENFQFDTSSKCHLKQYITFASQCLNDIEQDSDSQFSNNRLERIIKMNSTLQLLLVKYSKDNK